MVLIFFLFPRRHCFPFSSFLSAFLLFVFLVLLFLYLSLNSVIMT